MKKLFLLVSIGLLWGALASAQKMEMGKVSVAELEQKAFPGDTAAAAAVLFHKVKTTFNYTEKNGFTAVYEYQMRIKVYKKEGLEYASHKVAYYIGYENLNPETVSVEDGSTYNLVNGKIEKTKLGGQGTFKEKVNENWKTLTLVFPNAKVGSVLEFRYVLRSENINSFPTVRFQENIPVAYAEYRTEIPEFYIYKQLGKGNTEIKTTNSLEHASNHYTNQYNQSEYLTYNKIVTTHAASNIPALKAEEFLDNIDNYRSAVSYELELIRYPDKPDKNIAKTWDGLAKNVFESKDFGKQLDQRGYFEPELKTLLSGLETDEAKINAIFNFVKTKIKWNGNYGIYADRGVVQAYADRTGNLTEVNFILIALLNHAGFNANPVLLSTRENGISLYPNRTSFNAVIAAVELPGQTLLLDASEKFAVPGILPQRDLNWVGRLIRKDGSSKEMELFPKQPSAKTITMMYQISPDGAVTGKLRQQMTDYYALDFRQEEAGKDPEAYLEALENRYGKISIRDYQRQNEQLLSAPLSETYSFSATQGVEQIGNVFYLEPLLFLTARQNPFTQEKRQYPIYFGYPTEQEYNISITLPEGYVVESFPQTLNLAAEDGIATYKCLAAVNGNHIQLKMTQRISRAIISEDYYLTLKEFFKKALDHRNQKITFKKA